MAMPKECNKKKLLNTVVLWCCSGFFFIICGYGLYRQHCLEQRVLVLEKQFQEFVRANRKEEPKHQELALRREIRDVGDCVCPADNGTQLTEECNHVDSETAPVPVLQTPDEASVAPQETTETVPELDPELLQALGDASDDLPVYGPDIHDKLAQLWLPILKKGIQKEVKDKLLKDYSIPNNCKLLKAPTLNPEISAAVSDIVRTRDKKIQAKQDQLGLGISAINKAMSLLLTSDDKIQAVKILSDGCRILTDIHYTESQVRTKLITPGLEKAFLTLIQDQERDETLFGSKLPEKIKASKAIEKQGLQIKKAPNPKPSSAGTQSTAGRFQHQGNWSGPPRYPPSRRGGRSAAYKTTTQQPYRRPQPTTSAHSSRPASSASYNKHAPTKQ